MLEELNTADDLHKEGKLDKKLRNRLRVFKALSFLFGLITIYNILLEGFYWFHTFLVVAISFLFGFFILVRINKVVWDKSQQVVMAQKMDISAILILIMYICSRVLTEIYLKEFFSGNVSYVLAYTFFSAFGITLGRFVGYLVSIHLVNSENRGYFYKKRKKLN